LTDYIIKSPFNQGNYSKLSVYPTDDGSISIHSSDFHEGFHSSSGALRESHQKFLQPAQIERFKDSSGIHILDVCVGMGYNSACIIEKLISNSIPFKWWGLEKDDRPIEIGTSHPTYKNIWSREVNQILRSIQKDGFWNYQTNQGEILWGDARQKLACISSEFSFDLILLDPFSPSKCPMLWTEEFLSQLATRLAPDGRLLTYSCAAAIRASLRRTGLEIASQIPIDKETTRWSNGTIAISTTRGSEKIIVGKSWQPLSKREEEHLLTRAAVPYRDPSGKGNKIEILKRREREQTESNLEITNDWKKRWRKTAQS